MKKRSEGEWHALFAEQAERGLSATAFCREKGLCPKYYSLRQRQLGIRPTTKPNAFVSMPIQGVSGDIELCLGEALRVRIPMGVSPDWLVSVLKGVC